MALEQFVIKSWLAFEEKAFKLLLIFIRLSVGRSLAIQIFSRAS